MADASWSLDPRLAADSVEVGDLGLCTLRLMDDARWPWFVIVPRRPGVSQIHELDPDDQRRLLDESSRTAAALLAAFGAARVNVAAIGNVVGQLHVHHVLRSPGDPGWPGVVWGCGVREPYAPDPRDAVVAAARAALGLR